MTSRLGFRLVLRFGAPVGALVVAALLGWAASAAAQDTMADQPLFPDLSTQPAKEAATTPAPEEGADESLESALDKGGMRAPAPGTVETKLPENVQRMYDEGLRLKSLKRYSEAIAEFSNFIAEIRKLAQPAASPGQPSGGVPGVSSFGEERGFDPFLARAFFERGQCYAALEEYERATQDFSQATLYAGRFNSGYLIFLERGKANLELGKAKPIAGATYFKNAMDDFGIALRSEPANPEFLYYAGTAQAKLNGMAISAARANGQPPKPETLDGMRAAIATLNEALRINPEYADAYYERGVARSALGEQEDAVRDVERAVNFDPTNIDYVETLGSVFLQLARQRSHADPEDTERILHYYSNGVDAVTSTLGLLAEEIEVKPPVDWNESLVSRIESVARELDSLAKDAESLVGTEDGGSGVPAEGGKKRGRGGKIESHQVRQELRRIQQQIWSLQKKLQTAEKRRKAEKTDRSAAAEADEKKLSKIRDAQKQLWDLQEKLWDAEDKARPLLDRLWRLYVTRADTYVGMASFAPVEDRPSYYNEAFDDCEKTLVSQPNDPESLLNRGLVYRLRDAAEKSPADGKTDIDQARAGETGYQRALASFAEALKANPDFYTAYLRRGIVWYYLGEYDVARGDFDEVANVVADPRAMFWTGLCYAQTGRYADAVRAYTDALRASPDYVFAYTNRGLAYLQLGLYERASDDFNQVIRRNQRDALAYYRRGVAQQMSEKYELARDSFKQSLHWDGDLTAARDALRRLPSP